MTTTTAARRRWSLFFLKLLGGGVIGAVFASGALALIDRGFLTSSDYLPVLMATFYALLGLTVWINPYVRKTRAPGEPLWPRSLLMLVSACALATPLIAPLVASPQTVFLVVVAFYVVSWWIGRITLRRVDELTKRVVVETNHLSLHIILAVLLLYGAAERLNLVPDGVSIWMLNGILLWVYFLVTQFAWMRRGLDNPTVAEE